MKVKTNSKFVVTLYALRKAGACFGGYNKIVRALQGAEFTSADDERESYIRFSHKGPVTLESILASNGLDDSLWALRCVPHVDRDARLFAVWCARQVQHLMTDQRILNALDVAESFANGNATEDERDAALYAALYAAWDEARSAAFDAARYAAWDAAWYAARHAARHAAWDTARSAQKEMFVRMCNGTAPWQVPA